MYILVNSHFDLVSLLLALEATEPVSEPVTQIAYDLISWLLALEATEPVSELVIQMAVELTNIHIISVQQKR